MCSLGGNLGFALACADAAGRASDSLPQARQRPASTVEPAGNPLFTIMGEFHRGGCRRIVYAADLRLGTAGPRVGSNELCPQPAGLRGHAAATARAALTRVPAR